MIQQVFFSCLEIVDRSVIQKEFKRSLDYASTTINMVTDTNMNKHKSTYLVNYFWICKVCCIQPQHGTNSYLINAS